MFSITTKELLRKIQTMMKIYKFIKKYSKLSYILLYFILAKISN